MKLQPKPKTRKDILISLDFTNFYQSLINKPNEIAATFTLILQTTLEPTTIIIRKSNNICNSGIDGDGRADNKRIRSEKSDKRVRATMTKNSTNFSSARHI